MNEVKREDIINIINNIDYSKLEGQVILITGGNGFIGRKIVELLIFLNENYFIEKCKIIFITRNIEKTYKLFGEKINSNEFVLLEQLVEERINYNENVDYIIHSASRSNTRYFMENPYDIINTNVIGTNKLLEYCRTKKIKSFIFLSSGAVYGDVSKAKKMIKENDYFGINPLKTINSYAMSKIMGEHMCRCYWEQYEIKTKIVRLGHTYGPDIDIEDGRIHSDFINSILKNNALVINSNGDSVRSFCYISDTIIGIFLILLSGENGQAYNLTNQKASIKIKELGKLLTQKIFADRDLELIVKNTNDKKIISNTILDTTKLTNLGWIPKYGIEEGFIRTVKSFELDKI